MINWYDGTFGKVGSPDEDVCPGKVPKVQVED